MPLIMQPLQGELIDIYEKGKKGNASPKLVAIKTAKAYLNYIKYFQLKLQYHLY